MNANYERRVPTEFAPETSFEVRPSVGGSFGAPRETDLERLKERLLGERLAAVRETECNRQVRRAANEAAALALVTGYPLLVFPVLFEEKVLSA